jgi:hypothetical protein
MTTATYRLQAIFIELVFKIGKSVSFYATDLAEIKAGINNILDWRRRHLGQDNISTSAVRIDRCSVFKTTTLRGFGKVLKDSKKSGLVLLNITEDELRNYIDDSLKGYVAFKQDCLGTTSG